jgi:hypothetical protein
MLLSVGAVHAYGQKSDTTTAERCIPIKSIKQTKVVDDQNILFYVSGGKVYTNHLPHSCSGLASADTFKYKTSQSELCNVDVITVLNRTGGSLMPGATCGLGEFAPAAVQEETRQEK